MHSLAIYRLSAPRWGSSPNSPGMRTQLSRSVTIRRQYAEVLRPSHKWKRRMSGLVRQGSQECKNAQAKLLLAITDQSIRTVLLHCKHDRGGHGAPWRA